MSDPLAAFVRAWRWGVRRLLQRWVRAAIKPAAAAAEIAARPRPVCYVLECESQADLAVLDLVCAEQNLPRTQRRLRLGTKRLERAFFELKRPKRVFTVRRAVRAPRYLVRLIAAAAADETFEIDLIPVAVFWGRAPPRESSLWRQLFAEDWVIVGRFRRLLNIFFNGRNTLVYFGEPIRLRDALADGRDAERAVRRIVRALRAVFRAQQASTIGPDLSHRRTMVTQIINAGSVRRAIREQMSTRGWRRRQALLLARKYAVEIAANYSQTFINIMDLALSRLWNWLYDGVDIQHVENLTGIDAGAEVIYVPCHRSHMDYLLLSYIVYRQGFAIPHVAAGNNLNMPVIGRLMRKGGAFFLRRSFKGDPLYGAVFAKYLGFMIARGHPLEYFIEGGRSRTGRLLAPRTGMLSMTVRSYLQLPKRPVIFMPVYFGYERIVEGRTYIGELSGRPKQKESIGILIQAFFSVLRGKFGTVHVNLGAPIALDAVLDAHNPHWRSDSRAQAGDGEPRAAWIAAAIADLAVRIHAGINAAAVATPVNLAAMAILAAPRQALAEADLVRQIELYQRLLLTAPYSALVRVTNASGVEAVHYVESMGMLERQKHPLGDVLRMNAENAVLATYYRNNILHLVAMPSLLACAFLGNACMRSSDLQRMVRRVYPYVAAELYLRWDESQVDALTDELLNTFERLNLLRAQALRTEWCRPDPTSPEAVQLSALAQTTLQTLERYYLAIALLLQAGSGVITQEALEERCHLMAQRMAVLYGLDSPEFFDKSLFRKFIDLLRTRNVIQAGDEGRLAFAEPLLGVAVDAQLVLSEQIRHSILQVTLSGPLSCPR